MTSRANLPRHVAFIMDGNGRWAKSRSLLRLKGHERGAEALSKITRHAARIGIPEVTFFALSTENYRRRPQEEIEFLMGLLRNYLIGERKELAENNIRLRAIGRTGELPRSVQEELEETMRGSRSNTGMILRLALNYGSRQEIVDAVRKAAGEAVVGRIDPAAICEDSFRRFLYDPEMTDPDLLIRTAGEYRLSNFFLWQASYAELWVTEALWPDFDVPLFEEALRAYGKRERKFGAVEPSALPPIRKDKDPGREAVLQEPAGGRGMSPPN
jgi:undecaprenyl diphosphate synthase